MFEMNVAECNDSCTLCLSSSSSAAATKQPLLSFSLPWKILPDCNWFSLLWIYSLFILQSRASNPQPGGPDLSIYVSQLQSGPIVSV
jgi:hypothetical protein